MLREREHQIGDNGIGWPDLAESKRGLWHTPYVDEDVEMRAVDAIWHHTENEVDFRLHQIIGRQDLEPIYVANASL